MVNLLPSSRNLTLWEGTKSSGNKNNSVNSLSSLINGWRQMKRQANIFKNWNIMLWLTTEMQDYRDPLGRSCEIRNLILLLEISLICTALHSLSECFLQCPFPHYPPYPVAEHLYVCAVWAWCTFVAFNQLYFLSFKVSEKKAESSTKWSEYLTETQINE